MIELMPDAELYLLFERQPIYNFAEPVAVAEVPSKPSLEEKPKAVSSPDVLAGLPIEKVVEPIHVTPPPVPNAVSRLDNFVGSYTNGILIVTAENTSEESLAFLQKVLLSKSWVRSEAALFAIERSDTDFLKEIIRKMEPKLCLLFGIELPSVARYALVAGKYPMLVADRIETIADDDVLKKKLWAALKPIAIN
jgi:hypothetical protein